MIFTKKLTGATSLAWVNDMGFTKVTIQVSSLSTASATILGTMNTPNGFIPDACDIEAGSSVSFISNEQYPLEFTLGVPSGCVVNLIAEI